MLHVLHVFSLGSTVVLNCVNMPQFILIHSTSAGHFSSCLGIINNTSSPSLSRLLNASAGASGNRSKPPGATLLPREGGPLSPLWACAQPQRLQARPLSLSVSILTLGASPSWRQQQSKHSASYSKLG